MRLIAIAADRAPKDVQAAATAALLEHFAFAVRDFGQPVRLSEVYVAAQQAEGVLGVDVDTMTLADAGQRTAHVLGGQPVQDRIDLEPDELATLQDVDLTVTVAA